MLVISNLKVLLFTNTEYDIHCIKYPQCYKDTLKRILFEMLKHPQNPAIPLQDWRSEKKWKLDNQRHLI